MSLAARERKPKGVTRVALGPGGTSGALVGGGRRDWGGGLAGRRPRWAVSGRRPRSAV